MDRTESVGRRQRRPVGPGALMVHEPMSMEEFERLEVAASAPVPGRKTWDSLVAHELTEDVPVRFPCETEAQAKNIVFSLQKAAKKLHVQIKALVVRDPLQVIAIKPALMPEPRDTRPVVPSTVQPARMSDGRGLRASVVPRVPDPVTPLEVCGYRDITTSLTCNRPAMHGGNHRFFVPAGDSE